MVGQRVKSLNWLTGFGVAVACATGASAQTDGTFLITFDGVVTPQTPTMTVSIWATWDSLGQNFAFAGANYDLQASEGEFTGGTLMLGIDPPNTMGLVSGRWITGAAIGQICIMHICLSNHDNPILLANYDWTTTDFTPRTIDFDTRNTNNFTVGRWDTGAMTQLFPDDFEPGSAQYFVPASSTLAPFACGGLVVVRRQRTRRIDNA